MYAYLFICVCFCCVVLCVLEAWHLSVLSSALSGNFFSIAASGVASGFQSPSGPDTPVSCVYIEGVCVCVYLFSAPLYGL